MVGPRNWEQEEQAVGCLLCSGGLSPLVTGDTVLVSFQLARNGGGASYKSALWTLDWLPGWVIVEKGVVS